VRPTTRVILLCPDICLFPLFFGLRMNNRWVMQLKRVAILSVLRIVRCIYAERSLIYGSATYLATAIAPPRLKRPASRVVAAVVPTQKVQAMRGEEGLLTRVRPASYEGRGYRDDQGTPVPCERAHANLRSIALSAVYGVVVRPIKLAQ